MNTDETYRTWKERSRPLNISADFAGAVMRRVRRQTEKRQARWNWPGLLELLQRNRSFQFAALAIAAIAGLSRFWLLFSIVLKP
jgi:hypothetical protein